MRLSLERTGDGLSGKGGFVGGWSSGLCPLSGD